MNHASQCGYLAALDKESVEDATAELARKNPGIVDRLNAKVGIVKKRTHEDLTATSSSHASVPPLKRSRTEPILGGDHASGKNVLL